MSASAEPSSAATSPRTRWSVRTACAASAMVFLWSIAQFYQPATGFTSLISIGDMLDPVKVSELRRIPHFVYEDSAGYDGAYYAQLALHPRLDNPELTMAIDNLPYRARRILFSWVAWAAGFGQPAWILQAHALLNVGCWLVLAGLLFRWFPPHGWQDFGRWFAVMFSHGVCMSVRNSLVDAPSLLLVAVAMACVESGRRRSGTAVLALAGLGKETSLLAVTGLAEIPPAGAAAWRRLRSGLRFAGTAAVVALPLMAWVAYIRWQFGPAEDPGLGNFTLPLAGLAEKWGEVLAGVAGSEVHAGLQWATLAATAALTVQCLFFVTLWRPHVPWWRIGAAFAVMTMFLSTAVWEGYPGAASRVLLPMTLAFNVLVPRSRRWLPILIAGNLSVIASWREFTPPYEFYTLRGERTAMDAVEVERGGGWYAPEHNKGVAWRWARETATLKVRNSSSEQFYVTFAGQVAAPRDTRGLRVTVDGAEVLARTIGPRPADFRFTFELLPGEAMVEFSSDRPAHQVGEDERLLAFRVLDADIIIEAARP